MSVIHNRAFLDLFLFMVLNMISNSAFKYCVEDITKIENYELAIKDEQDWDCHHRLEIQEDKILTPQELIEQGLYYNRPASELIFLTKSEHTKLHANNRSDVTIKKLSESCKKACTEDVKKQISKTLTGRTLSEEHKRNISKATKGKKVVSEATKRKISEYWRKRRLLKNQ